MKCRVCGNSNGNMIMEIKEMMFGFDDSFDYMECAKCRCLQIIHIPQDMEKYYQNQNYYSFKKKTHKSGLQKFLDKKRDIYALFNKGILGKWVYKKHPNLFFHMMGLANVDFNTKILDIGCGAGELLYTLKDLGFNNLTGIDPFVENNITENGLKIVKKDFIEFEDKEFDLIILSHSLEHIFNQLDILIKVSNVLSKNGSCIVRTPIKTRYIWKHYGTNWVQIDAPRHYLVHSVKSFEILTEKAGLSIHKIIFDSNEFQFWGSEQYKNNITLEAQNSYKNNLEESIFTKKQIGEFKKKANGLNRTNSGDQAIFILKKK